VISNYSLIEATAEKVKTCADDKGVKIWPKAGIAPLTAVVFIRSHFGLNLANTVFLEGA
jgi:hypothetical protein